MTRHLHFVLHLLSRFVARFALHLLPVSVARFVLHLLPVSVARFALHLLPGFALLPGFVARLLPNLLQPRLGARF